MTLLRKCFGLHSEPHSLKRTSQMQTASTAAPTSCIDLYRQGMPSCTVPLYCIQPLYSHYTATIQPLYSPRSDVGGVGLYVGAPAERSGEIDKWEYAERIVQRRSGIDKWEYAERIVQREPDGPMVNFRAPQRSESARTVSHA